MTDPEPGRDARGIGVICGALIGVAVWAFMPDDFGGGWIAPVAACVLWAAIAACLG